MTEKKKKPCIHMNTVDSPFGRRLHCKDCGRTAEVKSSFHKKSGDLRQVVHIWHDEWPV